MPVPTDFTYPVGVVYLQPPQPTPSLSALLWLLSDSMHPSDPNRFTQSIYKQLPISGGMFSVPFQDATTGTVSGLSIQEDGWEGPLFRSGFMTTWPQPPPTDANAKVDIFVPDVLEFTAAEITDMADLGPNEKNDFASQYDGGITTALGPGLITVTLSGNKPAAFVYSVSYELNPSTEMRFAQFALERKQHGVTTSVGPVPGQGSTHFAGSAQWHVNVVMNNLEARLQAELAKRAIAAMAKFVVPAPEPASVPTALPTSSGALTVILSARRSAISNTFVRVWPSLGAWGDLANRLFPTRVQSPSGGKCALQHSVLLAAAGLDPAPFRAYRDRVLAPSASGSRAIAFWYEHGAEAAAVLDARPELARRVATAARKVEAELRSTQRLSAQTADRVASLLAEIAHYGSPSLRADVDAALRARIG